jgi:hypothetical protein
MPDKHGSNQACAKIIGQKQDLKDKLATAEKNRGGWFEPAIRFVKACKQAGFLASEGKEITRRDFLKKHGSNLSSAARISGSLS